MTAVLRNNNANKTAGDHQQDKMQKFTKPLEEAKTQKFLMEVCDRTIIKNPMRLIYIARNVLASTPELMQCTPKSFVGAVLDCAQLGLEPISILGQAYFVAYWNSRISQREVQMQIGYKGIMALARRSGEIAVIKGDAVYRGDDFTYQEGSGKDGSFFHHSQDLEGEQADSALIGAWAKAIFTNKIEVFKVTRLQEILKAEKQSQSGRKKKGPWQDWRPQMFTKTAIRRLQPWLPQSTMIAQAIAIDDAIDAGVADNARWRDLNEHGEKIDNFLDDLNTQQVPESDHPDAIEVTAKTIEETSEPSENEPGEPPEFESEPEPEQKTKRGYRKSKEDK